jgi:hypothetical protein
MVRVVKKFWLVNNFKRDTSLSVLQHNYRQWVSPGYYYDIFIITTVIIVVYSFMVYLTTLPAAEYHGWYDVPCILEQESLFTKLCRSA